MAVREGQDRRVGSSPEKLLTLEEAAQRLGLPADDVEAMNRTGRLTAFRLGGLLLRLRLKDVETLRQARPEVTRRAPTPHPSTWNRLVEFFYFNDFYLVAILIILTLLALIFTL